MIVCGMYLISSISLKSGFPQIVDFLRKSYEKKMHKNNTTSLEIVSPRPPLVLEWVGYCKNQFAS